MIDKQLKNLQIKYSSIATPPFIVDIDKIYIIEYLEDNIYIINGDYKHLINKELIFRYFSPVNTSWDGIFKSKNKSKEIVKKEDNKVLKES